MEKKTTCLIDNCVKIPVERGGEIISSNFISFKGNSFDKEKEHFAIAFGEWETITHPLVRIHSECITGDVFLSKKCDCGEQLTEAINIMSKKGGIILYLRQEGRGIGLFNKFKAYKLQDEGLDTFEANIKLGFNKDERDFSIASCMLRALGKKEIYLLSNNNDKKNQLEKNGIKVIDLISTKIFLNEHNKKYLTAKKDQAKHNINL